MLALSAKQVPTQRKVFCLQLVVMRVWPWCERLEQQLRTCVQETMLFQHWQALVGVVLYSISYRTEFLSVTQCCYVVTKMNWNDLEHVYVAESIATYVIVGCFSLVGLHQLCTEILQCEITVYIASTDGACEQWCCAIKCVCVWVAKWITNDNAWGSMQCLTKIRILNCEIGVKLGGMCVERIQDGVPHHWECEATVQIHVQDGSPDVDFFHSLSLAETFTSSLDCGAIPVNTVIGLLDLDCDAILGVSSSHCLFVFT